MSDGHAWGRRPSMASASSPNLDEWRARPGGAAAPEHVHLCQGALAASGVKGVAASMRTVLACVVVAMVAVAATATASSLITGSQIAANTIHNHNIHKNTVSLNRLTPGVQKLIRRASAQSGTVVPAGATGAPGPAASMAPTARRTAVRRREGRQRRAGRGRHAGRPARRHRLQRGPDDGAAEHAEPRLPGAAGASSVTTSPRRHVAPPQHRHRHDEPLGVCTHATPPVPDGWQCRYR